MSVERWGQVEELFLKATTLPESERDGFLLVACGADTQLREEVAALLRYDTPDSGQVDLAIQEVAARLADDDFWIGQRIGAYRIKRELGVGGMGAVYLADRDDQRFDKQVAIKIIHRAMDTPGLRRRLVEERRILAALDHPYIAKLIDGGETDEGVPYFVLEYVDGAAITRYAQARELSPAARCQLMIRVCEGVSYAHRNLVIHRDLKPSNILIASDGTPKLLDFGIARLLDPESGAASGARDFTPDYASPELAAGKPVATFADVYSLGVLLCELLTGSRTLKPGLVSRDLEAIIGKATAGEPTQRYQSPDLLAGDLRNAFAGYPVSARPATIADRSLRFVRRNKLAVAAGAVAFLGLSVTTGMAVVQARRAEVRAVEAEQARARASREHDAAELARASAVAQAAIAGERLQEFTALTDSTINDLNNALERMPGATQDRRKIVEDTLRFLDTTRANNPGNLALLRTAAEGYLRLSRLLGAPETANLGDRDGALGRLSQSEELTGQLLREYPTDLAVQSTWIGIQLTRADFLFYGGRLEEAARLVDRALTRASTWRRLCPGAISATMGEASLRRKRAFLTTPRDRLDGTQEAQMAIDLLDPLHRLHPEDDGLTEALAASWAVKQQTLIHKNDPRGAEANANAVRIREQLLKRRPEDVVLVRTLLNQYRSMGTLALMKGDRVGAREHQRRAIEMAAKLSESDPANETARSDLAHAYLTDGAVTLSRRPEEVRESMQTLKQAVAQFEVLMRDHPTPDSQSGLVQSREYLGRRLLFLGDSAGAEASLERSLRLAQDLAARFPENEKFRYELMRSTEAFLPISGRVWGATKAAAQAAEFLDRSAGYVANGNQRRFRPLLLAAFGDMWEERSDHARACVQYKEAAAAWSRIPEADKSPSWVARETGSLEAKLGRCQ